MSSRCASWRARPVHGPHLFAPALAYRVRRGTNTDTPLPPEEPTGENPPDGAIIDYALASPARRVVISIYDGSGRLVRSYSSDDAAPAPIAHLDKPTYWERPFARPSTVAGMHRFVWDLRDPSPHSFSEDLPISAVPHDTPRVPQGALVVPGRYTVRLDVDGTTLERPLEVAMDPRVSISQSALAAAVLAFGAARDADGPHLRPARRPPRRRGTLKALRR